MTIIEVRPGADGGHRVQSQSHRSSCWLEGWIEVPEALREKVWASGGYCELILEGDRLTDIVPTQRPPEPEGEADPEEVLHVLLGGEEHE